MKNIASRMLLLICAAAICTLFAGISAPAAAAQYEKALHVVADHRLKPNTISEIDDLIKVYDVKSDGCPDYRGSYPILSDEQPACDLAMFDDPNGDGNPDDALVFVTYKGSNQVDVYKAVALVHFGTVFVTGAKGDPEDLAGIVVEKVSPGKGRFYTVDRYTQDLYIYDITVTSSAVILGPAPGYSLPITLDGIQPKPYLQGAVGLAMGLGVSAEGPLLFVTDFTNTIHYYDTNNPSNTWGEYGTITISVPKECGVARKVSIAYDEAQKIVYAAGGFNVDNYLLKYELKEPDEIRCLNLRENGYLGGPIGLAVDPNPDREKSLLYITSGFDGEILRVFKVNNIHDLKSVCSELDGKIIDPAETRPGFAGVCAQQRGPKFLDLTGICIGPRVDVPVLRLTKVRVKPLPVDKCVKPEEKIEYEITVKNTGDSTLTGVTVWDDLPDCTDLVGPKDPWFEIGGLIEYPIGTLAPSTVKKVDLVIKVRAGTSPGPCKAGSCWVESDQTAPSPPASQPVKVCDEYILKLTKKQVIPSNNGCVEPGENVTFEIKVENLGDSPLTGVVVTDKLPPWTTCVPLPSPDDRWVCVDMPDPATFECTFDIGTLAAKAVKTVKLKLKVDSAAPQGQTFNGFCWVESDQTAPSPPVPQPVKVCVDYVLDLTKERVKPLPVDKCVKPEEKIEYEITVKNTGDSTLTGVTVWDDLPDCTDLVGPKPPWERVNGYPNRWKYPVGKLAPNIAKKIDLEIKVLAGTPPGPCKDGSCWVDSDQTDPSSPVPQPIEVCGFKLTKVQKIPVYKGCVEPGDNVTFEVCVENMGDTPLNEVLVEDTLPECTDFVDPQPPWECVDPPNCRTYKWDIGTLQPTKKECSDLVLNVRPETPPGDPCPGGSCTVSSKETGKSKSVPQPVTVCDHHMGGGNRPEFDTVGCDATNYFALRDGIMPRVVENAVDALGKKINLYSDFVPQGREYFTQTASDLYPDPCFPGYMSAYVDSSNQGIYEWLIVLQMKPESDIDLNIYDCVMKRYGASVWKSAGQTGWYTTDGGDDASFWAAANPTVTVAVVPGPYATPGFDAPFYLDGRTLTGLLPVSLVDVPYTSKAFWEEGIVIEMPMTGSINCLGETVYDLKQGDAIKVTISIPTLNTVDIRYARDNVILKYIGIVATEHCTDDACVQ